MEIITGFTNKPHITSEMDRDIHIGTFGEESYVLYTGTMLKAEVSTNNEIKIRDGVLMHQGCAASIKKNTYDSLIIANGSQGMKRIDLIVARYTRDNDTNIENMTLLVIQGEPSEFNPEVPLHIAGDIQLGDSIVDMPLYQVMIDGLNIVEVKKVFNVISNIKKLEETVDSLNSKLEVSYISMMSNIHFTLESNTPFPFDIIVSKIGNAFTVANGRVTVGDGVNHVRVFASLGGNSEGGSIWLKIRKNGTQIYDVLENGSYVSAAGSWILQVKKGDILDVVSSQKTYPGYGGVNSYFAVEKIS